MYNDCVFIRLVTSGRVNPLYLRCETPDLDSFGLNKDRFLIRFSTTPDNYCKFLIQTYDNHMRLLQMNGEVPVSILYFLSDSDITQQKLIQ